MCSVHYKLLCANKLRFTLFFELVDSIFLLLQNLFYRWMTSPAVANKLQLQMENNDTFVEWARFMIEIFSYEFIFV